MHLDNKRPTLGFVGAGKVGGVLARLWSAAGYQISAVYSRTDAKAGVLAEQVGAAVAKSIDEVVAAADLTLLTVTDDAIELVAEAIGYENLSGKAVIHTSGVHDARALSNLAEWGAFTGSLHPAFPFADAETAILGLRGAVFALEAETPQLKAWLEAMVKSLDGKVLTIPLGGKATYHAALVFASNYTVTLYAVAEQLLGSLGADSAIAARALIPLLTGTLNNLREQGIPDALTGPLVRGDVGTIELHLDALKVINPELAGLYRELARATLPLLVSRNIKTDLLEWILRQDENHAVDDS